MRNWDARRPFLRQALVGAFVVSAWGTLLGCSSEIGPAEPYLLREDASTVVLSPEQETRIVAFCSDCHAMPQPGSFARDRWHIEARKGYEFYARSGRNDLDPPPFFQTLAYYRSRAPERLTFPAADETDVPSPVAFRKERRPLDSGTGMFPGISHLDWVRLAPDEDPVLLASDMRYGHIVAIDLGPQNPKPPRALAQLRNPCRIELCDLNDDGKTELVVADLGSRLPADHERGRVVLLQRRPDTDTYEPVELATGLGRVADVRASDVDGDGRLDLIVGEFGWRETGGILLFRNSSEPGERPRFERKEIDDRPGAIHLPVHDFTGDGRPDFAALVSQEHETIELFINAGQTRFVRCHVWAGTDLTFGSSGIELTDLNGDGRLDILYTNGDALDNNYVSPWHGVGWLENRGGLEFAHHRLTEMSGAYRALPGDFDGDGDLDIVVVAWLPPDARPASLTESPLASILLLEQTGPGVFSRHTLESGFPYYATLAVGDFEGDGDLDFAVAPGPEVPEDAPEGRHLTIWWNDTPILCEER